MASRVNSDILQEIKRVIKLEASALCGLEATIGDSYVQALDLILECQGKVITTGIGKSGLIARKIASTLTSTGTLSVYLHPSEALHGDLGLVQSRDVILAVGKSGESSEMAAVLPRFKSVGAKIVAITGRKDSTLAKVSDAVLWAKTENEACPYDLAPTASAVVAMAIGDALALSLMKLRGFKPSDFAQLHPGGNLGFRLSHKVSDLMLPLSNHPPLNPDQANIEDVIARMGTVGLVLFSRDGKSLDGIMTDGDVRRALARYKGKIFDFKAVDLMNSKPQSLRSDMMASDALSFLEDREFPLNVAPVMSGAQVVGVLKLHDLFRG